MTDSVYVGTSGYLLSAIHRVINRGSTDRYSAPFFYNGNTSSEFTPLTKDGEVKEQEVQTVEGHILGKLRASRKVSSSAPKVSSGAAEVVATA